MKLNVIIMIVILLTASEINKNMDKNLLVDVESILYVSCDATLSNGVKYKFIGRDVGEFSINDYINSYTRGVDDAYWDKEEIDAIVLAKTPAQAAENGIKYLCTKDLDSEEHIIVVYCAETDSWMLEISYNTYLVDFPSILVINRSDGRVVKYTFVF